MDILNAILSLLSRTQGRDKSLRLIQYATLYSVEDAVPGAALNVFKQIRTTRKVLRFLRTLEYSSKIRSDIPLLKADWPDKKQVLLRLFTILQNLFTFLFFISDHRVCLSQLGVISKEQYTTHYPKSMKNYLLQNVFGVLKNIVDLGIMIMEGKHGKEVLESEKGMKSIKRSVFDLIRCMLDILVALYYLKGSLPANRVGIIGVITSLMAIIQSLKMI